MEASSKRKRDLDCPRITFHAPGRTFERLLREDSLEDLKNAIKTKLGFGQNVKITLAQMRNDTHVVLEDEDDFDAFYNFLHSSRTASVSVTIGKTTPGTNAQNDKPVSSSKKKKLRIAPQSYPVQEDTILAPTTSNPASTSRKRAVSFVQPADSKSAGEDVANALTVKRSKTTSTTTEPSDIPISASAAQPPSYALSGASSSTITTSQQDINAPSLASLTPGHSSSIPPTREAGGRRSSKKRKKATKESPPEVTGASEIAKVIEEANESFRQAQSAIEVAQQASTLTAVAALSTKESSTNNSGNRRDTKAQETLSTVGSLPSGSPPIPELPKERVRSKSNMREKTTSAVNSEMSDTVPPGRDHRIEENMTTITQLMIGKYMTPVLSTDEVAVAPPAEALVESQLSAIVQPTVIPLNPKPKAKSTCPYCGKISIHSRSRCPMIRTKNLDAIERRIADLKQDATKDINSIRANAIEVLENALLRKQGVEVKKKASSNGTSSVSVKLVPSAKPPSTMDKTSSTTIVTSVQPLSSSVALLVSPGPHSSPEGDVLLQNTSKKSPSYKPTPRVSPSQKLEFSLVSQTFPKPSLQTLKVIPAAPFTDSESQSQSSPEAEISQTRAQVGSSSRDSDEDSNEESSFEDETTAVPHCSLQLGASNSVGVSEYSDKDLEAIIRGPGSPLKSTELPSSESSEDEGIEDIRPDNESEGQKLSHSLEPRRPYMLRNDSSDEEVGENNESESDGSEDKIVHTPVSHKSTVSVPPVVACAETRDGLQETHLVSLPIPERLKPFQGKVSFQEMNRQLSPVEPNKGDNDAFEQVLAEDTVLGLARQGPLHPSINAVPRCTSQSPRTSPELDQGVGGEVQGLDSTEAGAKKTKGPEKKNSEVVEEVEPAQTTGSDSIEDSHDSHARQGSPIEDYGPTPALPLSESSIAEPERAATPKPGIFSRMKNHINLARPEQPSSFNLNLNLTVVPSAKPRSKVAELQNQQTFGSRSSQSVSSGHEGSSGNTAADGPAPTPGNQNSRQSVSPMIPASKLISTRSVVTAKKRTEQAELDEEQDIPLRRSARAAARIVVPSPQLPVASLPGGSQPSTKKGHQMKAMSRNEDIAKPTRSVIKKQNRGAQIMKRGGTKGAAKSPTSSPPKEDTQSNATETQTTELAPEVRLPPSPPVSLDVWEIMQSETPAVQTHSDVMVDELQSDEDTNLPVLFPLKPQFQRKSAFLNRKQSLSGLEADHNTEDPSKGKATDDAENNPLFMPSESQTAFPHSQFQSQPPDPRESDSSGSEEEVRETVIKPPRSQPRPTQYRRLSDIASQAGKLFTPKVLRQSTGLQSTDRVLRQRKERLSQIYGKMGTKTVDDGSDDTSGKGSESDTEISHIPKSRKAGAGLKGRMSVA